MASATLGFLTESLWKDQAYSDVDLEYSGHVFHLHRLILRQSPFLSALLDAAGDESSNVLKLEFLDDTYTNCGALEVCLTTLYGLDPALDEDNILSVLACAFELKLERVCDACFAFMPNIITPSLFSDFHAFNASWNGKEYNLLLAEVLDKYLCRTASTELRPILHKLPKDELRRLFASDILWVTSETERFQLILEIFGRMKENAENPLTSGHQEQRFYSRGISAVRASALTANESAPVHGSTCWKVSDETWMSQESGKAAGISRVYSEPIKTDGREKGNSQKLLPTADETEFLEEVLNSDKIFYACLSFAELTRARFQAQSLGLKKVVGCIENSLWTKATLEGIIISEATKRGDLPSCRSFDQRTNLDLVRLMNSVDLDQSPCYRHSTEIEDIKTFRQSRDFTSEQFYFCGSLFRVVLTIRYDETSQDQFVGMYLQRTIITSADSWQFCDPRSNVNIHVEFLAGTRILEIIELEGRLEVPHNNKGYSRFLYLSQLPRYLSPSGSLRITSILKLVFGVNEDNSCD